MMNLYKPGRPVEYRPFEGDSSKKPPRTQGEYRILNERREIKYIGISYDLNRRMNDHIRTGKLNEENCIFAYQKADGRASQERIREHERQKIDKHNPELNQRRGGGGRKHK